MGVILITRRAQKALTVRTIKLILPWVQTLLMAKVTLRSMLAGASRQNCVKRLVTTQQVPSRVQVWVSAVLLTRSFLTLIFTPTWTVPSITPLATSLVTSIRMGV